MVVAVAVLKGEGELSGTVRFTQEDQSVPVKVEAQFSGLKPGKHGFHIQLATSATLQRAPIVLPRCRSLTAISRFSVPSALSDDALSFMKARMTTARVAMKIR
ncbi:MAG: hypothetical protein BJ554DRAFT_3927 [Olpidium bornovanus]|uniref:Superoxide dismutase copper/zinc binding domain-containing protein n=1 Tax=Olpidium bornovanus TaxID=278681 RepID=A0A8H7ZMX5_9FUNG|nr:MAG: hypothetical protein BJ554DRAFT_3927 [Olpidium bornovanus]